MDARRFPRSRPGWAASVGRTTEHVMPTTDVVDISANGALLAFLQPVGVVVDERLCISIATASGRVHRLARVVRSARGDDFRSYVAVEFEEVDPLEHEQLLDELPGE